MTLRRTVAPAATPVSLSGAKDHLRVTGSDEDAYIQGLISAAVSHVDGEGDLGRAMITQTWAQWVCQSPGHVRLKMGPFQALVSVEFYDAAGDLQTATLSDFETWLDGDFAICKPKDGFAWPGAVNRPDAIKITYRAGFGDAAASVPAGIRRALLGLIEHWYANRGAITADATNSLPLVYDALIGNERVGWYG